MDRRRKRTQDAIFDAFTSLVETKEYSAISIQEIIDKANIGRSTFYTHFNTKEDLVKSLCEMLFEHIFESALSGEHTHGDFKSENNKASVLCHMIHHLEENDHHILTLMSCDSRGIFTGYFKAGLKELLQKEIPISNSDMPKDFVYNHLASSFIEMIEWWLRNGKKENPDDLEKYFFTINAGLI